MYRSANFEENYHLTSNYFQIHNRTAYLLYYKDRWLYCLSFERWVVLFRVQRDTCSKRTHASRLLNLIKRFMYLFQHGTLPLDALRREATNKGPHFISMLHSSPALRTRWQPHFQLLLRVEKCFVKKFTGPTNKNIKWNIVITETMWKIKDKQHKTSIWKTSYTHIVI